jgi:splicing factor 3B subunit 4
MALIPSLYERNQ